MYSCRLSNVGNGTAISKTYQSRFVEVKIRFRSPRILCEALLSVFLTGPSDFYNLQYLCVAIVYSLMVNNFMCMYILGHAGT
jgi:hypothetical protein